MIEKTSRPFSKTSRRFKKKLGLLFLFLRLVFQIPRLVFFKLGVVFFDLIVFIMTVTFTGMGLRLSMLLLQLIGAAFLISRSTSMTAGIKQPKHAPNYLIKLV